jgi:hypothetical protein
VCQPTENKIEAGMNYLVGVRKKSYLGKVAARDRRQKKYEATPENHRESIFGKWMVFVRHFLSIRYDNNSDYSEKHRMNTD